MQIAAAAFLGIVQGLTEFLPVSSSAHLVLVPWLFGWKPEGLTFDVALHVGTALALLVYFRHEWIALAREAVVGLVQRNPFGNPQRRLAWYLVVGTIPAGVVGLAGEDYVDAHLRSPLVIVVTLVLFAAVLLHAERAGRQRRRIEEFTWGDTLWIGCSQALALVPGVSRSGVTISAALLRDADRVAATKFSFLLSTPVIAGAGLREGLKLVPAVVGSGAVEPVSWPVFAAGVAAAMLTGMVVIRLLLRYVQTRSFVPFVVYRVLLAGVVLALFLGRG